MMSPAVHSLTDGRKPAGDGADGWVVHNAVSKILIPGVPLSRRKTKHLKRFMFTALFDSVSPNLCRAMQMERSSHRSSLLK